MNNTSYQVTFVLAYLLSHLARCYHDHAFQWLSFVSSVAPDLCLFCYLAFHPRWPNNCALASTRPQPPAKGSSLPRGLLFGLALSLLAQSARSEPQPMTLLSMIFFSGAHLCYVRAFGMKPMRPLLAAVLLLLFGSAMWLILPTVQYLNVRIGVFIHGFILMLVVWRATARMQSLCSVLAAVGSVLLLVAYLIMATDSFSVTMEWPKILAQSAYYLGQLGVVASAMDILIPPDDHNKSP